MKKRHWRELWRECLASRSDSGGALYDRACLIREIWGDADFQNCCTEENDIASRRINELTKDQPMLTADVLMQMLLRCSDRKRWAIGDIQEIYDEMMLAAEEDDRKNRREFAEKREKERREAEESKLAADTPKPRFLPAGESAVAQSLAMHSAPPARPATPSWPVISQSPPPPIVHQPVMAEELPAKVAEVEELKETVRELRRDKAKIGHSHDQYEAAIWELCEYVFHGGGKKSIRTVQRMLLPFKTQHEARRGSVAKRKASGA